MDEIKSIVTNQKDEDSEHPYDKALITLMNHHRKRAFLEMNVGSDEEVLIANHGRLLTRA